jgi:RNA polymerase subunit RPABC4/transcription elongation factor Spt4
MPEENYVCPECESEEFITEPNQYDVLVFEDNKFIIQKTLSTNDKEKIICRECWTEVDIAQSIANKRVILLRED